MKISIATPYSTLFENRNDKIKITGLSDLIELREPWQFDYAKGDVLFHCDLSLVAPWGRLEHDQLREIAGKSKKRLIGLSFHVLSRYACYSLKNGVFVGNGKPMKTSELFENAIQNMTFIKTIFSISTQIFIENNNHLGTDSYDIVTDPEFLNQLMDLTGAGLLWDIAHSFITANNTGQNIDKYLENLCVEKTCQIHLSRHSITRGIAWDSHGALKIEDWQFFTKWIPNLPMLKYVTIEYYQNANSLIGQLVTLRELLTEGKKDYAI